MNVYSSGIFNQDNEDIDFLRQVAPDPNLLRLLIPNFGTEYLI